MAEKPGATRVSEDEEEGLDENDPGETASTFATKGMGWSGRDEEQDDPLA